MAIVSFSYYVAEYFGETIAEADFPKAEAKAERAINQITHGRLSQYDSLPSFQQEAIVNAICAQIEYYAINGIEISVNGSSAGNWTVGKVRVDNGNSKAASGATTMVCAGAIAELELTGLLNPQVPTLGEPVLLPYPWGVC